MAMLKSVGEGQKAERQTLNMLLRGLNRVFCGMLVQNFDELLIASSGSLTQSKASPLLDQKVSVQPQAGQWVRIEKSGERGVALVVKVGRDVNAVELLLTPTRFEFLGRVAQGTLPSSFSLECQEDLLAFKAQLLAAVGRQRKYDKEDEGSEGEISLQFLDVGNDGRATIRPVTIRI